MNIAVCIKQVPDTANVRIDPKTNTLIRQGVVSIINPFDMYAIEEAVRTKERLGGRVTAITMGPPQAEDALREAISMGVDEAVLASDRAFAGSDTWATSYTLACTISKLGGFDIIFCGKQAADGDTAQVGPGISMHLGIPQVTYVKKIEELNASKARVERMTEEGYEIIETPLPVLFTVVKEINQPRIPSLKGKMRARSSDIRVMRAQDIGADERFLGLNGSPTQVVKVFTPPPREGGVMITGSVDEITDKIVEAIKNECKPKF